MTDQAFSTDIEPTGKLQGILLSDEQARDVRHVLDLLSSSLDWGSGFLTDEDVEAWNRVAMTVGYPALAVKEPQGPIRPNMTYGWTIRPLVKCTSHVDTSMTTDGGVVPVKLECCMHEGHRGQHRSESPVSQWWV